MWSSQLLSAVVVSADRPTVFMPRVDVLYPGQAGSATIRREVRAGYQYQKPAHTHTYRHTHTLLLANNSRHIHRLTRGVILYRYRLVPKMNLVAFYSISLQTQTQTAGKTIDALCIIRDSPVANRVKVKTVSAGFLKCWVRLEQNGQRRKVF